MQTEEQAKRAAYMRAYYQRPEVKEKWLARQKEKYHKSHEEHLRKRRIYESGNRERIRALDRAEYARWKQQIFDAYGNRCACCGESEPKFLAVDHKDGGGQEHRRSVGGSATQVFRYIIKSGFPPEFQLLCHNCNMAKGIYGVCPHQLKEKENVPTGIRKSGQAPGAVRPRSRQPAPEEAPGPQGR